MIIADPVRYKQDKEGRQRLNKDMRFLKMATSEKNPDENMSNEELKKLINVGKDKMSKSVAQTLNDESDINESFEGKVEVKRKDRES